MINKQACIFLNGTYAIQELGISRMRSDSLIIGVDGGTRHLSLLNKLPDVIIGDMDSLPEVNTQAFESTDVLILRYPTDKNETDFELALNHAIEQNCDDILVFGAIGGRTDQMLANLLLPLPHLDKSRIVFLYGKEEIFYIISNAEIHGNKGDIVSLLPINGDVKGIRTTGLHYPLLSETLPFGKSRGISNELESNYATVSIASGILICVHTFCGIVSNSR